MRERTLRELHVKDDAITLEFRPFEIKTVFLGVGPGRSGRTGGSVRARSSTAKAAPRKAAAPRGSRS
jgi:hypothetical protein